MTFIDPTLKRFFAYVKPYRTWIIAAAIAAILKFGIPLAFPLVVKEVINLLVAPPPFDMLYLHEMMGSMFAVYVVWTGISYLRSYFADLVSQRMIFDLRQEFFQHVQTLSLGFFERRQVGTVASRLLSDVAIAQNFVSAAFINTVMDLSTLLIIAVILLNENTVLALLAFTVIPVYAVINRYFQPSLLAASKQAQTKMEEIAGQVHEQLAGVAVVQAYTREKSVQLRFFGNTRDHLDFLLKNVRRNALAISAVSFLTQAAPVLVLWYGAILVMDGQLSPGGLVAFYAYLGMLYAPLNRLTELNVMLANSRSAMERIFEVLDTRPIVTERVDAVELPKGPKEIVLRDVTFAYEGAAPVLQDVTLTIPAGSVTALVGKSGAGKTTLAKLIPRFYDVTKGSLLIGGIDVASVRLKSLRNQISVVAQEPFLFSGTVDENIRYGRPRASEQEVVNAAMAAHAHEFILGLPLGYHTEIGERGVLLSGGQKQRLALARAFIKDAPLLILDEATSSLDSESEHAIQEALKQLMRGRTTVIIAHRLSTVREADQIAVFDQGRIVQVGRHNDLVTQTDGLYCRLYQTQFRDAMDP